jgi:hypothetical protein
MISVPSIVPLVAATLDLGLFDVYTEVVVDPRIIEDWPFSGWDGGDIGHTWLMTACKQEKPCVKEAITGRCGAQPSA